MPKKCITHFDGKPCTGNYDSSNEKVSVFRFPKDPQERALWVNVLPSKVNVRDESVLCEKLCQVLNTYLASNQTH